MKNLTRTTFVALAIFMSFFLVQSVLAGPRCDQVVEGTVQGISTGDNSIFVDTGDDVLVVYGIPDGILQHDLEVDDYVYIEARARWCQEDELIACSITMSDGTTITLRGRKS